MVDVSCRSDDNGTFDKLARGHRRKPARTASANADAHRSRSVSRKSVRTSKSTWSCASRVTTGVSGSCTIARFSHRRIDAHRRDRRQRKKLGARRSAANRRPEQTRPRQPAAPPPPHTETREACAACGHAALGLTLERSRRAGKHVEHRDLPMRCIGSGHIQAQSGLERRERELAGAKRAHKRMRGTGGDYLALPRIMPACEAPSSLSPEHETTSTPAQSEADVGFSPASTSTSSVSKAPEPGPRTVTARAHAPAQKAPPRKPPRGNPRYGS